MWLFLPDGFVSVVAKGDTDALTMRARVHADLERLRAHFSMGPITASGGTDYQYRALISREDFADGLASFALDIDYANFKTEVERRVGSKRERTYHKVWSLLLSELRDERPNTVERDPAPAPRSRGGRRRR